MTSRRFERVQPITRATAAGIFDRAGPSEQAQALLSLAYHDPDWRWVQDRCLEKLANSSPEVRNMAALCLGHLARIHRSLELERVLPVLTTLVDDPIVGPSARDALDDIRLFLLRE